MYLNLVKYLASRFRNRGEPIDDLVQVGTIGLIKAIDRFDIERAGRVHDLRDADDRRRAEALLPRQGLGDQGPAAAAGAVVPREPGGRRAHAEAAALAHDRRDRRVPRASRPKRCSRRWRRARRTTSSRSRATAAATAPTRSRILEYIGKDDTLMAVVDDRTTLAAAFKELTPQEQRVLYLRFFEGLTQTEIARQLDISQMQVSRLLRRTLRGAAREHREGVSGRDHARGATTRAGARPRVAAWAIIGMLVLMRGGGLGARQIAARARAVRHRVRDRVPAAVAGARARARGMSRGLRPSLCASSSASWSSRSPSLFIVPPVGRADRRRSPRPFPSASQQLRGAIAHDLQSRFSDVVVPDVAARAPSRLDAQSLSQRVRRVSATRSPRASSRAGGGVVTGRLRPVPRARHRVLDARRTCPRSARSCARSPGAKYEDDVENLLVDGRPRGRRLPARARPSPRS